MLDIDLLKEEPKTVVHCPERWQAEMLIIELGKEIPGEVYIGAIDWWDFYRQETCYFPKFYEDSFYIEHCNSAWYRRKGFKVLEFDDVVYSAKDLGEFDAGIPDISVLFGGM